MQIRERREGDIERCVSLLRLTHEHDRYPVTWPDDPARWVDGGRNLAGWVAEDGEEIVGQVLLRSATGTPVPVWEQGTGLGAERLGAVSRLLVGPGLRRAGIGRSLLRTAVAEARRRELVPVLDVLVLYEGARTLYESEGWTRIGEFEWEIVEGWLEPSYAYALLSR